MKFLKQFTAILVVGFVLFGLNTALNSGVTNAQYVRPTPYAECKNLAGGPNGLAPGVKVWDFDAGYVRNGYNGALQFQFEWTSDYGTTQRFAKSSNSTIRITFPRDDTSYTVKATVFSGTQTSTCSKRITIAKAATTPYVRPTQPTAPTSPSTPVSRPSTPSTPSTPINRPTTPTSPNSTTNAQATSSTSTQRQVATKLPNTGASSLAMTFTGTSIFGYLISLVRRKFSV